MNRISAYLFARIAELRARSDEGVSAVEYGSLLGLITVGIIVSVALLGTEVKEIFEGAAGTLEAVNDGTYTAPTGG